MARFDRHGARAEKIYKVWCSMRHRCSNSRDKWYVGVAICKRWDDFETFRSDMGAMPSPSHQIDRIKNHLGYTPSNCRWVTPQQNALNRRSTRWIKYRGKTQSMSQWAADLGLSVRTIKARIDYLGWPLEKALTPGKHNFRKQGGKFA